MGQIKSKLKSLIGFKDKNVNKEQFYGEEYRRVFSDSDSKKSSEEPANEFEKSSNKRKLKDLFDISVPNQADKKLKFDTYFHNLEFIKDKLSIKYISNSKVMLVLRGSSSIERNKMAETLKQKFPSSFICSIDQYFVENNKVDGDYSEMAEARLQCTQTAISSARNQIPVIIINNANMKLRDIKQYTKLAKEYNYVTIILDPQIYWSGSISDQNSHSDDVDKQIKLPEKLRHIYYGWFINEVDSYVLTNLFLKILQNIYEIDEFKKDFQLENYRADSLEELKEVFEDISSILHCTARFTIRGNEDDVTYMESGDVKMSIGMASSLKIVGFTITPRTISARIKLNNNQLKVWGGDDNEPVPDDWLRSNFSLQNNTNMETDQDSNYSPKDNINHMKTDDFSPQDNINMEMDHHSTISQQDNHMDVDHKDSINGNSSQDNMELDSTNDTHLNDCTSTEINSEKEHHYVDSPEKINKSDSHSINGFSSQNINEKSQQNVSKKKKFIVEIPDGDVNVKDSIVRKTLDFSKTDDYPTTYPTEGKGSRAHVTIGVATGEKPVTAGLDTLLAIQLENSMERDDSSVFTVKGEDYCLRSLGHSCWSVYLTNSLEVMSLFSTFD